VEPLKNTSVGGSVEPNAGPYRPSGSSTFECSINLRSGNGGKKGREMRKKTSIERREKRMRRKKDKKRREKSKKQKMRRRMRVGVGGGRRKNETEKENKTKKEKKT
jgi:hypothetical protein